MKRSGFDREEYELYRRYQMTVHDDTADKVTESSYRRFLVESPFPSSGGGGETSGEAPSCGYGAFHQQYRIDGRLVAVGVVDILPKCLSSKYLFWDPDFHFLSLGKYSALQEIEWVKRATPSAPTLQFYYLGYYIHSCPKMRYKAAYAPCQLLCPKRFDWVPYDLALPLIEQHSFAILSDALPQHNPQLQDTSPPPALAEVVGAGEEALQGGGEEEGEIREIIPKIPIVVEQHVIPLQMCFAWGMLEASNVYLMDQLHSYVKAAGPKLACSIGYKLG